MLRRCSWTSSLIIQCDPFTKFDSLNYINLLSLYHFSDDEGPYYRKITYEIMCEWKAKQKGLPSPMSEDDRSPAKESNQDAQLPKGAAPGATLPTGGPPPPGGPLPQVRPCPVGGPHLQDGPLPPNRPCAQGEAHPPDGQFPLGGLLAPGRPFPPGRPLLPTVQLTPSARENDVMSGRQGWLIKYQLFLKGLCHRFVTDFFCNLKN